MTTLTYPLNRQAIAAVERPQLRRRDHILTVVFAAWMMFGLFLDGYAHSNIIDTIESFFTPWHAVFYSGFTVTAMWMIHLSLRHQPYRKLEASAIPVGYGLGLVGVALFGLGGVGDIIWHSIFGIEANVEALMSPTHLMLWVGGILILSSPVRAAWHSKMSRRVSFGEFLPSLLSLALTTAMIAFFFMYLSPFTEFFPTQGFMDYARDINADFVELSQGFGIAQYLWTTAILVTPLLLALRRWDLPFGSATVVFTTTAFGLSAIQAFDGAETVLSALVGALVADVLIARYRPSPRRPGAYRAVAAAVPAVMWVANFAIIDFFWGIGWVVEFWAGTIVLASITSFAIAFLLSAPGEPASSPPGASPSTWAEYTRG